MSGTHAVCALYLTLSFAASLLIQDDACKLPCFSSFIISYARYTGSILVCMYYSYYIFFTKWAHGMYVCLIPAHVTCHKIWKCYLYIMACMYGLFHLLIACDPTMKGIEQIWKPKFVALYLHFYNLLLRKCAYERLNMKEL